ncbi:MAG: RNA polymerase subunit sigma-24 [Chitinophaga sp.]|jgi:RNA polymerase sigma-70 factor (TIGR02943 family)|nr:RNA polymerase subunit sigma-24 [Chitinophaga sp.]
MSTIDTTALVNDYSDLLYRFALPRVNDKDLAKDLVQDTFVSALKNIDSYKAEASLKNWLMTILKNKIIDHYRKAATRLTDRLATENDSDSFFEGDGHWSKPAYPKDWAIPYGSRIEQKEFYSVFELCMKKLKEIQHAVFSMKYLDDIDSDEICKQLNITASNYWVLIHRAKTQLRSCLEKNWFTK